MTATTETATDTAKAPKAAATRPATKARTKKAPAVKAPAKKAITPTKVSKRREVVADTAAATAATLKTALRTIPIDRIDRDENQPREIFDEDALQELADSMKEVGQQQAITVRYLPATKRYAIISGERRWRAAGLAGLTEMHAMVVHGLEGGAETLETFTRSVAENLGRADMTPLEEARAFKKLMDFGLDATEVAKRVGKSWNHVDNRLQLLKLTPAVQEALLKGHLPVGLAWYVAQISPANQNAFIARWSRGQFNSPREAEQFCQRVRNEETEAANQSVMFILADEAQEPGKTAPEGFFPELEVDVARREQIVTDRQRLVSKIGKLGAAGEILAEIAAMDVDELAILLSGAHGGIPGNRMRIDHLKDVASRASLTISKAATAAAVRAGSIRIAPDALPNQTTEDAA
ncbi:ParB/RepB/Spo0J family partition protein [Streptomyces sp. TR1341]|uniref:ParB/RepB/Spo0J family partition protein n=1 Tax=Streptomyces sp. TR1341 TaxID=2601266 RepID=UPI00138AC5E7|nr:ParB/RepB/Spo0J family partition protein [Streptomyces sp. TR1341]